MSLLMTGYLLPWQRRPISMKNLFVVFPINLSPSLSCSSWTHSLFLQRPLARMYKRVLSNRLLLVRRGACFSSPRFLALSRSFSLAFSILSQDDTYYSLSLLSFLLFNCGVLHSFNRGCVCPSEWRYEFSHDQRVQSLIRFVERVYVASSFGQQRHILHLHLRHHQQECDHQASRG